MNENRLWVITATIDGEVVYWSNEWGWADWEEADIFTDDEKESQLFACVIDGVWLEYR